MNLADTMPSMNSIPIDQPPVTLALNEPITMDTSLYLSHCISLIHYDHGSTTEPLHPRC